MGWHADAAMLQHPTPLCSAHPFPRATRCHLQIFWVFFGFFFTQGISQTCLPSVLKLHTLVMERREVMLCHCWRRGMVCITHITSSSIASQLLPVLLPPPYQGWCKARMLMVDSRKSPYSHLLPPQTPSPLTLNLHFWSLDAVGKKGYLNTGEDWIQDVSMF